MMTDMTSTSTSPKKIQMAGTVGGDVSCLMIWEARSHNEVPLHTCWGDYPKKQRPSKLTNKSQKAELKQTLPPRSCFTQGVLTTATAAKPGLTCLRAIKWCERHGKIAIAQKLTVKLGAGAVVAQWQSPHTQLWLSPWCDKGSRIKHQGRGLRFTHLHSQLPGAPLQPVQMNQSKNTLWSSKTTSGYASKSIFINYFHGCFKHNSQGAKPTHASIIIWTGKWMVYTHKVILLSL